MAEEMNEVFVTIWIEKTGKYEEEAREWLRGVGNERFAGDVFDKGVGVGVTLGHQFLLR